MRYAFAVLALVACQAREQAGPRVALPAGARVVQPLTPAAVGERLETSACYAGRSPDDVAREVQAGLVADWGPGVRLLPNAAIPGRYVVVGAKGDRGLAGVIEPARAGSRCADGEVAVSLGVHPIPAESTEGTAGPAGMRQIGQGRAPVVVKPEP